MNPPKLSTTTPSSSTRTANGKPFCLFSFIILSRSALSLIISTSIPASASIFFTLGSSLLSFVQKPHQSAKPSWTFFLPLPLGLSGTVGVTGIFLGCGPSNPSRERGRRREAAHARARRMACARAM